MRGSYKPILRRDIEHARAQTNSHAEAARYLNIDYGTYRKYAKMYDLFDGLTNQGGRGTQRPRMKGAVGLDSILAGERPTYSKKRLKERLIDAGLFVAECALCGFNKERDIDGRVPLVLHCLDGNHFNLRKENLQLRCFNCTYLTTGRVSAKPITGSPTQDFDLMTQTDITLEDIDQIQEEIRSELGWRDE